MSQALRSFIQTLTVCLIVIVGAGVLYAWSGPSSNPPSGNAPAPINTSNTPQTKYGDLTLNGQLCLSGVCRSTWPSGGGGSITDTNAGTECSGSNTYLSGAGTCETDQTGSGGDGYIGDYEYGGHDARSDLNMGYYDLCLNGDCRNSWPSGGSGGGDGYIGNSSNHTAGGDLDMNVNSVRGVNVLRVEHLKEKQQAGGDGWIAVRDNLWFSSGNLIHMGGNDIKGVGWPNSDDEAANKSYVDSKAGSMSCPCGTCWDTKVEWDRRSDRTDEWKMCTPAGWKWTAHER